MATNFHKKAITGVALITTALFLFVNGIDKADFELWDEQTNIAVVQESAFPTLLLNSEPFFEKPPLWYWITSGFQFIFGQSTWIYRIVSVLSGLSMIITLAYIFYKKYNYKTALISGLIFLSIGQLFVTNASGYFSSHTLRSADLDGLQLLLILLSFLCFAHYLNMDLGLHKVLEYLNFKSKEIYITLGFVFSALAVMTKGPFGLLPIIVYVAFEITLHRSRIKSGMTTILNIRSLVYGTLIFLIVTIPWHLWMYLQHGQEFIEKYFGYHIIQRATTTLEEHHEPLWFYVQMLFDPRVFSLGILLIPAMIYFLLKRNKTFWIMGSVYSIIFVLVTITIIPTKLAWYLLYIYPFAVVVLTEYYRILDESDDEIWKMAFWIQIIAGLGLNTFAIITGSQFSFTL